MDADCLLRATAISMAAMVLAVGPDRALAQTPSTLAGVAYDSLHNAPLAGAMISLVGTSRSATSDARGRFRFDSVTRGTYTVTMLHAAVDSIGLSGVSARVVMTGANDTARVSIPSFATLWRAACGASIVPKDSGFVFGTVREARRDAPVAAATVAMNFMDYGVNKEKGLVERHWTGEAVTGDDGSYVLCGLPLETSLRMLASRDSLTSGVLDIPPSARRVQRRDVYISAVDTTLAQRGVVTGMVRSKATSQPVAGVRLMTPGATEVRSGADGRFTLRDVPLGTRQIDALSVGTTPISQTVDVRLGDTAAVTFDLERVTVLDKVKVKATSIRAQRISDMEERRERGMGKFIDSIVVRRYPTIGTALTSMNPNPAAAPCAIYVDGVKQVLDSKPLAFRSPADVAQIEMHTWSVPMEFRQKTQCLVLLVWTKNGLP